MITNLFSQAAKSTPAVRVDPGTQLDTAVYTPLQNRVFFAW